MQRKIIEGHYKVCALFKRILSLFKQNIKKNFESNVTFEIFKCEFTQKGRSKYK